LKVNSKSKGEFNLIVNCDLCRVRHWGLNYFDTVIDVGANVGVFSMMMKMLHPKAKILAVEPSYRNLKELKSNIRNMEIDLETRGLGDGSTMYHRFGRKQSPVGDWFTKENESSSFSIETAPFWQIFWENGCDFGNNLFVKIDCEGCEQYLIGDRRSEEILVTADQIFLEVHFIAPKEKVFGKCVLEFSDYDNWIKDIFSRTHDIEYYKSDKNRGFGHYCIRIKTQTLRG
jgi:FkbM family methyltransferase